MLFNFEVIYSICITRISSNRLIKYQAVRNEIMNGIYRKHNKIYFFNLNLIIVFLFFMSFNSIAQDYSTDETDQTKLKSLMGLGTEQKGLTNITQIPNTHDYGG